MSSLESIRREFPALEHWHHFDSARKTPLPAVALEAIASYVEDVHTTGGLTAYSERLVEQARQALARLAGTSPERLAFTSNASEGINYVAAGLDWRRGDNVVITASEHPANVLPWRRLAECGVELRIAPLGEGDEDEAGEVSPEQILALVDERTRVISISWVSYTRGHRINPRLLAAACRGTERLLVIDGIQGMGIVNETLRELGADVFVCGAHKGLFGLPGSGFIDVSERALEMVKPTFVGRHSYLGEDPFEPMLQPTEGSRRFEYGNRNYLAISVLGATAAWLDSIGLVAIEAKIRRLSTMAINEARGHDIPVATSERWSHRAGILAIPIADAADLRRHLRDRGFLVSTKSSDRGDLLRISFQIFNDEAETLALMGAISEYRKRRDRRSVGTDP